jgi:hypothetical protein
MLKISTGQDNGAVEARTQKSAVLRTLSPMIEFRLLTVFSERNSRDLQYVPLEGRIDPKTSK